MIVCLLNGLTRKQENTAIYYYLLIGTSLFFVIPFFLLGILPMLVFKNGGRLGFLFNQTTEINVIVLFGIAVWGAGFAAYIFRYIFEVLRYRKSCKWKLCCEPDVQCCLDSVRKEMRIGINVTLGQRYNCCSPEISGVFRPCICLPVKERSESSLKAIFTHELVHYRHGDLIFNHWFILIAGIHWFNPAVGRLHRDFRLSQELYCDYDTCRYLGSSRTYIRTLLETAVDQQEHLPYAKAFLSEDKATVLRRVERMKLYQSLKKKSIVLAVGCMLVFTMCGAFTSYAVGNGVAGGYQKLYRETVVEVLEETQEQQQYIEYTDTELSDLPVNTGEVDMRLKSMISFEWDVPNGSVTQSPAFDKTKDDTVIVSVTVKPADKTVKVGLVEPDNSIRYINVSGNAYHIFEIKVTGTYSVFVENTSGTDVKVEGSYTR